MRDPATWAGTLLTANPMVNKELRGRMRGARSIVVLTVYLAVLALFCLLTYWLVSATQSFQNPYDQHIGRDLLYGIVIFETLLVVFLAPAFTVGAISGERERQTFDLLMTTLLRPRAIVLGKMISALAFLLLLILAVAPLASLAFMFGGVAPEEIAGALIVLIFAALLYGSIGFFWSTLMRSTVASTVLTYGTLLVLLLGAPFIWTVTTAVMSSGPGSSHITDTVPWFYLSGLWLSSNPLIAMAISENYLQSGKPLFFFTDMVNGQTVPIVQPWLVYCLLALLGSAILLAISTRLLPPVRRHAPPPRTVVPASPAGSPPLAPPPVAPPPVPPAPEPSAPAGES